MNFPASFKIIASDYDGTLRKNGVIDLVDLQSIATFRKHGNLFGIVTGRAYDMIHNELEHYGVDVDFLICNNGSVIFDKNGKALFQVNIEHQVAMDLIAWLEKEDDVKFGACEGKHYFAQSHAGFARTQFKNPMVAPTITSREEVLKSKTITAFFSRKNTPELTMEMGKRMERDFGQRLCLHHNQGTIDIGPKDVTKSTAIKALQELYPYAEITVIGDDLNDLDMVRDYHGFGIISGHEELKKVASHLVHNLTECIELLMK